MSIATTVKRPSPDWPVVTVMWWGTLLNGDPAEGEAVFTFKGGSAFDPDSQTPIRVYKGDPIRVPITTAKVTFDGETMPRDVGFFSAQIPASGAAGISGSAFAWECQLNLTNGESPKPWPFWADASAPNGVIFLSAMEPNTPIDDAPPSPVVTYADFAALRSEVQKLEVQGITASAGFGDAMMDIVAAHIQGPGVTYDKTTRILTIIADPAMVLQSLTSALAGDDLIGFHRGTGAQAANIVVDTTGLRAALAGKADVPYVEKLIGSAGSGATSKSNVRLVGVNPDGSWPSVAGFGQPTADNTFIFWVPDYLKGTKSAWPVPPLAAGQYVKWDSSITATVAAAPNVTASVQSVTGLAVTFTAAAQIASGTASKWDWVFSDGSTASGQTVTHTFATYGGVTGTVTLTDSNGLTAVSRAGTTLTETAPTVVVSSAVAADGKTVTWTATATGAVSYSWTGTDGLAGSAATVTKSYTTTGSKTATCTVLNSSGVSQSNTGTVSITSGVLTPPPASTGTASQVLASDTFTTASTSPSTRTSEPGTLGGTAVTPLYAYGPSMMSVTGGKLVFTDGPSGLFYDSKGTKSARITVTISGMLGASMRAVMSLRNSPTTDDWLAGTVRADGSLVAESQTAGGPVTTTACAPAGSVKNGDRVAVSFVENSTATDGSGTFTAQVTRAGSSVGSWTATVKPSAAASGYVSLEQAAVGGGVSYDDVLIEALQAAASTTTATSNTGSTGLILVSDTFATASTTPATRASEPGTLGGSPTTPVAVSGGVTVSSGQLQFTGTGSVSYSSSGYKSLRAQATITTNAYTLARLLLRSGPGDNWTGLTISGSGEMYVESKTANGSQYARTDFSPAAGVGTFKSGDRVTAKFQESSTATNGAGILTAILSRAGADAGTWSVAVTPDPASTTMVVVQQGNSWNTSAAMSVDDLVVDTSTTTTATTGSVTPPATTTTTTGTISVAAGGGSLRPIYKAKPVAGGSLYAGYHWIFGTTQLCAPVGDAPDWNPSDRYAGGRKIKSGWGAGRYWPTINTADYSVKPFVVDSSKPEGPVASGGGGYYWQPMYQANDDPSWYQLMRARGGRYELETGRLPVPIGFRGANGTDASAAVYDIGTDTYREFWQVKQQTQASYDSANPLMSAPQGIKIPVGQFQYTTCAVQYNITTTGDGGFQYGNVVASAMYGAGIQIGFDEACAAAGISVATDGTVTQVTPVLDAIQHMIGIEVPSDLAEGAWNIYSRPARFSDADHPVVAGIEHGQRLQLDPGRTYDESGMTPFVKALCWTLKNYGATVTDRSGNVAFRGEADKPWDKVGLAANPQWNSNWWLPVFNAIPWDYVRSVQVDWYGTPIGRS